MQPQEAFSNYWVSKPGDKYRGTYYLRHMDAEALRRAGYIVEAR